MSQMPSALEMMDAYAALHKAISDFKATQGLRLDPVKRLAIELTLTETARAFLRYSYTGTATLSYVEYANLAHLERLVEVCELETNKTIAQVYNEVDRLSTQYIETYREKVKSETLSR